MLEVQSRAYRQQYGCNFITVVLNNLFGENDNFDYENSHVIPAMIRKIYEAKQTGSSVELWGDGSPLSEFTYSGDLAEVLLFLLENYNDPSPINIGQTTEHSIKETAELICEILEYDKNNIFWNTSKPMGQMRKPSDNSKLMKLGWKKKQFTDFRVSLVKTCNWFVENYESARGVK